MRVLKQIFAGVPTWFKTAACVIGICAPCVLLADSTPPRLYPMATLPMDAFSRTTESNSPAGPSADNTAQETPPGFEPVPRPAVEATTVDVPKSLMDLYAQEKSTPGSQIDGREVLGKLQKKLETARYLRTTRQAREAEPLFVELLADESPESIRQSALLELAAAAQDQNDLPRAQQVYAQFLSKWPNDLRVPEILLRQGLLFRQMGLNNLALTKFYGVMTSALVLKNDQMEYYVRLVQQAQMEIADTHYTLGKYKEAADFFTRLMKQTNSHNKSAILYKLTRCHSALGMHAETITDAQDFLTRFPDAPEQPEVRFYFALSLKQLGRDSESLQQVLLLLREQRELTKDRPAVWAYWQQRAGNLIGNYLYREGDYNKALDVYLNLVQLDAAPTWRLPVNYQIAMTYERLWQPKKAAETYMEILKHEKELADTASPSLKSVFEMSRWRLNFINWESKAEEANRQFHPASETNAPVTASLESNPAIP